MTTGASRSGLLDHPVWTAAVGVAVGVIGATALTVAGFPDTSRPAPRPDATSAFLAAWRSHLLASWSVDVVDERTTAAGARAWFQLHIAQRPPDSIEEGGGTVSARRGATVLACGPGRAPGKLVCRSVPAPQTWDQDVDAQMAALAATVSGPRAVYAVSSTANGCFRLTLRLPGATLPPTLGRGATYCLDTWTWAVRSSEVQRAGAVDRITTTSSHAPATDLDLALPADATSPPLGG